jgi:intracellular multiplication protein IcmK
MDSTGQPWPIQAYSIGDPTAFNIQWDRKGNTLLVQAASYYKRSNLAVILRGLDTPVMITLLSGQEVIDYRVDLRVPGMGPNAVLVQNGLPDVANPLLLDVLNGIPPKGSKTLKVSGGDCQAWLLNNRLFLRTNLDIISPAWKSVMSSIDGTHAYELQPAPVVLALQRGKDKTLILTIEGFE